MTKRAENADNPDKGDGKNLFEQNHYQKREQRAEKGIEKGGQISLKNSADGNSGKRNRNGGFCSY